MRCSVVFRPCKVSAAVFYGVSSVAIMTCNKVVLTGYNFPSAKILALSQIVVTMVVITLVRKRTGPIKLYLAYNELTSHSFDHVRGCFRRRNGANSTWCSLCMVHRAIIGQWGPYVHREHDYKT